MEFLNNSNQTPSINSITFSSNTTPESIFDLVHSLISNSPNYKVGVTINRVTCFIYKNSDFQDWCNRFNKMLNEKGV